MARRMGIHYDRLNITSELASTKFGATVDVILLQKKVIELVSQVVNNPSCVLPSVVNNPYFENV